MSNVIDLQVVVLMGGMGTRLGLGNKPKTLADIHGLPFFCYEMKLLLRYGFHRFVFLVGLGSDQIQNFFGDGSKWGVEIQYSNDGTKLLGTGGAVKNALPLLDDDFMLIYGDSFMDVDYREIYGVYMSEVLGRKSVLMTVYNNNGRYDKSNVSLSSNNEVTYNKFYVNKDMTYIDYGISIFKKEVFQTHKYPEAFDLAELVSDLSNDNQVVGLEVFNRFYEIGNMNSLSEFQSYAKTRFVESNKAIFWDRDGVINEIVYNEDVEQLDSPLRVDEIRLIEGIMEVMKKAQELGYLMFIVTNQPAAAKGKVKLKTVYEINNRIIQELRDNEIMIEGTGLCPHHPKGSENCKDRFLIRECECRKPSEGLISEILSVYNIDVMNSYMIGDSFTDVLAGSKSRLRTILIGSLKCDACKRMGDCVPDYIVNNIEEIGGIIK